MLARQKQWLAGGGPLNCRQQAQVMLAYQAVPGRHPGVLQQYKNVKSAEQGPRKACQLSGSSCGTVLRLDVWIHGAKDRCAGAERSDLWKKGMAAGSAAQRRGASLTRAWVQAVCNSISAERAAQVIHWSSKQLLRSASGAYKALTRPALAMLMVCCSRASCRAALSPSGTPSNSSMQHRPPAARIARPIS